MIQGAVIPERRRKIAAKLFRIVDDLTAKALSNDTFRLPIEKSAGTVFGGTTESSGVRFTAALGVGISHPTVHHSIKEPSVTSRLL